jgi:hypothetical protein
MAMKTTLTPFVLILAASTAGCAVDIEKEFATAAVTSSLESARKQNAAGEVVEAVSDCNLTAEDAVQEAADRPVVGLYPATCVTKNPDGDDLHVQYDGCTGVFGKADISGGIDAHVEVTGECQLFADITDTGDLTNHGQPFDYSATADVVVSEGMRDVDWRASWSGLTKKGRTIEQTSEFNVLVDDASSCRDISGAAEGIVDGEYPYEITIANLSICPEACPSKGTVVAQWQGFRKEREVTIDFDGSDVAVVTGWSGRTFDVPMVCGDADVAE